MEKLQIENQHLSEHLKGWELYIEALKCEQSGFKSIEEGLKQEIRLLKEQIQSDVLMAEYEILKSKEPEKGAQKDKKELKEQRNDEMLNNPILNDNLQEFYDMTTVL